MTALQLAIGVALLMVGSEVLVRGSVVAAKRLGVSPLLIGLTLVGFGTSAPELVVSLEAAIVGAPALAVGNIVGASIANILLILGSAAILLPLKLAGPILVRDGPVLAGACIAMVILSQSGAISRPAGILLLVLFAVYVVYTYRTERVSDQGLPSTHEVPARELALFRSLPLSASLALALSGLGSVVLGAFLLLNGALQVARDLGVSEAVIGLTLVSVGTVLPELTTSIVASVRRHDDVAIGNVFGGVIFNLLGIGGITAIVAPLPIPPEIARFDIWVLTAAVILLLVFVRSGGQLGRREGWVLFIGYGLYLLAQVAPG